jgi:hypothetical protein
LNELTVFQNLQHEEQVAMLKELHGKMQILHRQHCIEEEEFQKQLETQTLQLMQQQHTEALLLLKEQHEAQVIVWHVD